MGESKRFKSFKDLDEGLFGGDGLSDAGDPAREIVPETSDSLSTEAALVAEKDGLSEARNALDVLAKSETPLSPDTSTLSDILGGLLRGYEEKAKIFTETPDLSRKASELLALNREFARRMETLSKRPIDPVEFNYFIDSARDIDDGEPAAVMFSQKPKSPLPLPAMPPKPGYSPNASIPKSGPAIVPKSETVPIDRRPKAKQDRKESAPEQIAAKEKAVLREEVLQKAISAEAITMRNGKEFDPEKAMEVFEGEINFMTSDKFKKHYQSPLKRVDYARKTLDNIRNARVAESLSELFRAEGIILRYEDISQTDRDEWEKIERQRSENRREAATRRKTATAEAPVVGSERAAEAEQGKAGITGGKEAVHARLFGALDKMKDPAFADEIKERIDASIEYAKSAEFKERYPSPFSRARLAREEADKISKDVLGATRDPDIANAVPLLFRTEGIAIKRDQVTPQDILEWDDYVRHQDALNAIGKTKPLPQSAAPAGKPVPAWKTEAAKDTFHLRLSLSDKLQKSPYRGDGIEGRIEDDLTYLKSDLFKHEIPSPLSRVNYITRIIEETADGRFAPELTELFKAEGIMLREDQITQADWDEYEAWKKRQPAQAPAKPSAKPAQPVQPPSAGVQSNKTPWSPLPKPARSTATKNMPPKSTETGPIQTKNYEDALVRDPGFMDFLKKFPDPTDDADELDKRYGAYKKKSSILKEFTGDGLVSQKLGRELKGLKLDAEGEANLAKEIEELAFQDGGMEKIEDTFETIKAYRALDEEYRELTSELAAALKIRVRRGTLLDDSDGVLDMIAQYVEDRDVKTQEEHEKGDGYREYVGTPLAGSPKAIDLLQKLDGKTGRMKHLEDTLTQPDLPPKLRAAYAEELKELTLPERLKDVKEKVKLGGWAGFFHPESRRVKEKLEVIDARVAYMGEKTNAVEDIANRIKDLQAQYKGLREGALHSIVSQEDLAGMAKAQLDKHMGHISVLSLPNATLDQINIHSQRIDHIHSPKNTTEFARAMKEEFEHEDVGEIREKLEERTREMVASLVEEQMALDEWGTGSYKRFLDSLTKQFRMKGERIGSLEKEEVYDFVIEKVKEELREKGIDDEKRIILHAILAKLKIS